VGGGWVTVGGVEEVESEEKEGEEEKRALR